MEDYLKTPVGDKSWNPAEETPMLQAMWNTNIKCHRTVNECDDEACLFEHGSHTHEEEFYPVSEDIWKKFDLPPTPPRSPKHEAAASQCNSDLDNTLLNLNFVSEKLEDPHQSSSSNQTSEENLQSNLIQDCMWSAPGLLAAGITPDICTKPAVKRDSTVSKLCTSNTLSMLDINSTECVDPAAVFPYPLNDTNKFPSLGIETPSESEDTEDEDEEDDDDDDDDEEIDVVSVSEHQGLSVREHQVLSVSTSSSVSRPSPPQHNHHNYHNSSIAAMHNYSSSQPHPSSSSSAVKLRLSYSAPQTPSPSSSHHHHSAGYKRSRPSSSPTSPQPLSAKRQKLVVTESDLRRVVQKLKLCRKDGSTSVHSVRTSSSHVSRSSSDSEGDNEGKRAQHNVLERKRRNDLKSNFLRLRDNVPDISSQERAPKVVILRKSADYISSLAQVHRQLESEKEHQKRLQERLKRRLAALHREML